MTPSPAPYPTSPGSVEWETATLYEELAGGLQRYSSSLAADEETARDAVQEIFVRYLIERSYGRTIEHPRAWFYQVLRNYLWERHREIAGRQEVSAEEIEGQVDPGHNPETLVERSQMLHTIVVSLSGRELQCLELRAEGMSYQEIGTAMEVRVGTVGVLLSRALDKIRRLRKVGALGVGLAAGATYWAMRVGACIPNWMNC